MASLKIATPGSYVITAKAYGSMDGSSGTLACVLDAHGDSDRTQTQVAGAQPSAFGLEVVHSFVGAGSVDLNCSAASSYTISVNWIKIVAIRVGQLTNTAG